jgi:hypothetical protein
MQIGDLCQFEKLGIGDIFQTHGDYQYIKLTNTIYGSRAALEYKWTWGTNGEERVQIFYAGFDFVTVIKDRAEHATR